MEAEDKWGIKPLQNKLFCMLCDIDDICKKNDIQYSLAYGSVLGAIRHQGFIPWDDDIDIYLTNDSYQKLKIIINNIYSSKYYVQEFDEINGKVLLPKIRCNGTTYIEKCYEKEDMHHGIYIDIFILHNGAPTILQRIIQNFANQYLNIKALSNKGYDKKCKLLLKLLHLFPYNFLRKAAFYQLYRYDQSKTDLFYDTDLRKYSKSFYSKDTIFPTKDCLFEGRWFPVPKECDRYLTNVYGDYLKIPPLSSIQTSQHASFWSVDKDFREFMPNIIDFSDEKKGYMG